MNRQPRQVIWKYPLILTNEIQSINMPMQYKFLQAEWLNGPTIWALVDANGEEVLRLFRVYGTGEDLDDNYSHCYIGTCFQKTIGITYVWHVFQVMKLDSAENG